MKYLVSIAFLLALAGASTAEVLLLPPAEPVKAGESFEIKLYVTNSSDSELLFEVPSKVSFRLVGGEEALTGEFVPEEQGTQVVGPRSFVLIKLRGMMPEGAEGALFLHVDAFQAEGLIVAAPVKAEQERAGTSGVTAGEPIWPAEERISRHISIYDPVYFIVGFRNRTNAKFQLSFKYRFFSPDGNWAKKNPWISDFYLGYTQLSFWDIESFSKPFRDNNYRPSVFYYRRKIASHGQLTRLGLQAGFEHESNGRAGAESRSINILFLRPVLEIGDRSGYHWTVSPKGWVYLDKSDNPQLDDFRGYGELMVKYGASDGMELAGTFRKGSRRGYGSIQADLSIPFLRTPSGAPVSYILLQYFTGWGESLLDYNQRVRDQIRVGFMIIR